MDDPRYSELLFLRQLAKGPIYAFHDQDGSRARAIGLSRTMYAEMAAALVEDLYARFSREEVQLLVGKPRGEVPDNANPGYFHDSEWKNPRHTLGHILE